MLGLHLYVFEPDSSDNIRLFFPIAVGIYFGSESINSTYSQWVHKEAAIGTRFGLGVDIFPSNHFKLGVNAGFHMFITKFESSVGARDDYGGFELSLNTGYIF